MQYFICQFPENRWVNQKYNFDNIFNALMSLFVLSSKDGWVDIMYHGLDAVGIDQQVGIKCHNCHKHHLQDILLKQ